MGAARRQSDAGARLALQGREHALAVLVDHTLGGGVKDCWPTEGRSAKVMRNAAADAMAASANAFFEDVDAATAATLLATALANPPCPEQDDQIQDVAANLYLTRARTELLARLGGLPPPDGAAEPDPAADTADVLRIKVTIQGTKPPVWRRLEVPATITLARLHSVLQTAFGWTNSHLHGLRSTRACVGPRRSRMRCCAVPSLVQLPARSATPWSTGTTTATTGPT